MNQLLCFRFVPKKKRFIFPKLAELVKICFSFTFFTLNPQKYIYISPILLFSIVSLNFPSRENVSERLHLFACFIKGKNVILMPLNCFFFYSSDAVDAFLLNVNRLQASVVPIYNS